MLYAHCLTGESPLLEWVRTEYIKSTHFTPPNFKHSPHRYKASINSFSVRCQQSIILSTGKTKIPASAPGTTTTTKPGRGRAWQRGLFFLLWYPRQCLPPGPTRSLRILLNPGSSLPTGEEAFAVKRVWSLCSDTAEDTSRRIGVTWWGLSLRQGLPGSSLAGLGHWKRRSVNLVNDQSIQELLLFLLTHATENRFQLPTQG